MKRYAVVMALFLAFFVSHAAAGVEQTGNMHWIVTIVVPDTNAPIIQVFRPLEYQLVTGRTLSIDVNVYDDNYILSGWIDANDDCVVFEDANIEMGDNNNIVIISNCLSPTDVNLHFFAMDGNSQSTEVWKTFRANTGTTSTFIVIPRAPDNTALILGTIGTVLAIGVLVIVLAG